MPAGISKKTDAHDAVKPGLISRYFEFVDSLSFSHYGLMTMAILIGSCLGSITAMVLFYAGASTWVFAVGLFATLANLVVSISQMPTRWMVTAFLISVVVNLALIAAYPLY